MKSAGLATSAPTLIEAAKTYFDEKYENPPMKVGEEIEPDLRWSPSIHFQASEHLTVAVEVTESPYPSILRLRHAEITTLPRPIAVYSVCPEEEFLKQENQAEIRQLKSHGYGLISVD